MKRLLLISTCAFGLASTAIADDLGTPGLTDGDVSRNAHVIDMVQSPSPSEQALATANTNGAFTSGTDAVAAAVTSQASLQPNLGTESSELLAHHTRQSGERPRRNAPRQFNFGAPQGVFVPAAPGRNRAVNQPGRKPVFSRRPVRSLSVNHGVYR